MSENLFGLTVAADKGLDDLQCQRLLIENRRYQEVMLQYRCALKALKSRLEILNEEFSLQHDRNPIESTIAMDFWASLEHTIRYKKNLPINAELPLIPQQIANNRDIRSVSARLKIKSFRFGTQIVPKRRIN